MEKLAKDWLTNDLIDFEYKKYILLAYLKNVGDKFENKMLFPHLQEVKWHYENTWTLQQKKALLKSLMPGQLSGIDWDNFRFTYEKKDIETESLEEIDAILNYAIPKLGSSWRNGEELFQEILNAIEVSPVGLLPIYCKEGYLFVYQEFIREVLIYYYQMSIYQEKEQALRSINTTLIEKRKYSFSNTFENIKLELIRANQKLPNPATYLVEVKQVLPFQESVLPVAKHKIACYIQANS